VHIQKISLSALLKLKTNVLFLSLLVNSFSILSVFVYIISIPHGKQKSLALFNLSSTGPSKKVNKLTGSCLLILSCVWPNFSFVGRPTMTKFTNNLSLKYYSIFLVAALMFGILLTLKICSSMPKARLDPVLISSDDGKSLISD